jgi:CHAD domain-containing protein
VSVELIAEDPPSLAALRKALGRRLTVGDGVKGDAERVFYDTFDGLLYEAGLTHETAPGVPPRPSLSEQAREAIGVRALLPVAHVRVRSTSAPLLDEREKTVARVSIERLEVLRAPRRQRHLRPRVVLTPLRGYDHEVAHVSKLLAAQLKLAEADVSVLDEAVTATGADPGGVSSAVDVPLSTGQRSDRAAAMVLARLQEVVELNLPGTLEDIDSEFMHDYRVALRKARSVLRELRNVFPQQRLKELREELKWLQTVTGARRDLDVYVLDFEELRALVPAEQQANLAPVKKVLERRRGIAHVAMLRDIRGRRARAAMKSWSEMVELLERFPVGDRPDAARPIEQLAAETISDVYRRMVKLGQSINHESHPEEYHELRKQGKELRYLLELFAKPLYDGDHVKTMIKALKRLQDVLGRHQDRETQANMLRSLADEVHAVTGGPQALMAMGVLVQRLEDDAAAARVEFFDSFRQFSSAEQQSLVKETFRR